MFILLDIDECELFHGGQAGRLCLDACVNTPGGYRCSCPGGYNLTRDGRSCKGVNLSSALHYITCSTAQRINRMTEFYNNFHSQISMNVQPDRTTAQKIKCVLTHMVVFSVSVWSAQKSLMLHMSKHRPRKPSFHFLTFWLTHIECMNCSIPRIHVFFPQSLWTQPLSAGQQGMFPGPKLVLLPLPGRCVQPFSSTCHVQGLSTASDRRYAPFLPARGKASPPPLHSPAFRSRDGWADAGQSCAGTCHIGGRGGDDWAGEESPAGKIYHQSNHVCVTVWLLERLGSKNKLVHKSQTSVNLAKDSGFRLV